MKRDADPDYCSRFQAAHRQQRTAYQASLRSADIEAARAKERMWYANNPQPQRDHVRRRNAIKYGVDVEPVNEADVYAIHGDVCHICHEQIDMTLMWPDPMSPSIDHVHPLARGGRHALDNLAPAHLLCNLRKGATVGT